MTLPSRHRNRIASPGGLMPSSLHLGHGGFPQYLIFTSERGRNILFIETCRSEWGSNPRSPTFQAGSFNHCSRGPPYFWRRSVNLNQFLPNPSKHQTCCAILRTMSYIIPPINRKVVQPVTWRDLPIIAVIQLLLKLGCRMPDLGLAIVLHCIALHATALHGTVLHCTALHW